MFASFIAPELNIKRRVRSQCFGHGQKIVTFILIMIPFIPLIVQLIITISTNNNNVNLNIKQQQNTQSNFINGTNTTNSTSTNSTSTSITGASGTGASGTMKENEQYLSALVTAVVAINLVHWIWGNGLLTVINLIRPSSDVWCSPTIFPVYGWDPSLGEHGQLIEKNKGKLRKVNGSDAIM